MVRTEHLTAVHSCICCWEKFLGPLEVTPPIAEWLLYTSLRMNAYKVNERAYLLYLILWKVLVFSLNIVWRWATDVGCVNIFYSDCLVVYVVEKARNILRAMKRRKANWISHVLSRNCLLKYFFQRNTEGTRRRGKGRKRLMDDFAEKVVLSGELALDETADVSQDKTT
jgi:hypothetical protein